MVLLAVHVLEQAACGEGALRVEGGAIELRLVGLEIHEMSAGDARDGARQAQANDVLVHAHDFEQLCAAIAGDGGNAHLRHDLEQALVYPLAVVHQRFFRRDLNLAPPHHLQDGLVGQVGVDGGGAETDQCSDLVSVARSAGLRHDIGVAAQSRFDQGVVHRAHCEQGGYGQGGVFAEAVDGSVRQDHHHLARLHRRHRVLRQLLQRGFEIAQGRIVLQVEMHRCEGRIAAGADRLVAVVGQHGRIQLQSVCV